MDEQQDKKQVVEWSFSFDKLGESINEQIRKIGGSEETKHEHFSTGLAGASSASVELDFSVGRVTVNALADSDSLIEAEVAYTEEMIFEVSGEADKKVKLAEKHPHNDISGPIKNVIGKIVNRDDLKWDIGLSPNIPLSLDINGGVGENRLDLSGLKLEKLKLNSGVGENHVTLPATGSAYKAKVKNGVGALNATISEGAALKLDIDGGVGSVNIQVPAGAAVRVTATSGLGGLTFPSSFKRVKGGSDFISQSGVWESEGYSLATQQIQIDYHGGVGGFKITTA